MVSDFPYQYVPVAEMPRALAENINRQALRAQQERPVPSPVQPLSEARREGGPLLVPTHLPEPFSYDRAFVSQASDPRFNSTTPRRLTFYGPAGEKDEAQLIISIDQLPPSEMRPFPVELKEGTFKPVFLKSTLAYLVRGSWGANVDSRSGSVTMGWHENAGLSLHFVVNEQFVRLESIPPSAFTEEELIKVAESLESY